ncbi:MAG: SxtJ family membrane protein [Bacteroidota bacterium]|nr:SxtJ family membrane protein [Candidatus Kapabacteria bacterium]MDW8219506.1 SxtJ family membrane protein [Bacteroidota bacterium]
MTSSSSPSFGIERELRTLIVLSAGVLVLYFVFHKVWLLWVVLAILLIGAFARRLAFKLAWIWMRIAEFLGMINSRILLSLVFFLILVPLALVRRMVMRRDVLKIRRLSCVQEVSLYHTRNHQYEARDLRNPW